MVFLFFVTLIHASDTVLNGSDTVDMCIVFPTKQDVGFSIEAYVIVLQIKEISFNSYFI